MQRASVTCIAEDVFVPWISTRVIELDQDKIVYLKGRFVQKLLSGQRDRQTQTVWSVANSATKMVDKMSIIALHGLIRFCLKPSWPGHPVDNFHNFLVWEREIQSLHSFSSQAYVRHSLHDRSDPATLPSPATFTCTAPTITIPLNYRTQIDLTIHRICKNCIYMCLNSLLIVGSFSLHPAWLYMWCFMLDLYIDNFCNQVRYTCM